VLKVETMMRQCGVQTQHLTYIASHLPQHLPQQPLAAALNLPKERPSGETPSGIGGREQETGPPSECGATGGEGKGERRRKKVQVPCRWDLNLTS